MLNTEKLYKEVTAIFDTVLRHDRDYSQIPTQPEQVKIPVNPKSRLRRNNPDVRMVLLTSPLYGSESSYSSYINQNPNNEMFQHMIYDKPRLIVKNTNDFYDKYFENPSAIIRRKVAK